MKNTTKPSIAEAALLSLLFLAYSNGLTLWAIRHGKHPESLFRRVNRPFLLLMLLYAALRNGGLPSVGIKREGLAKSVLGGTGLGAALSGPPLLFFFHPILLDTPLEYGPITSMTRREMIRDVMLSVPVSIAMLEELAFRGLLYSSLREVGGEKMALLSSAAGFAGWHFMVTATSAEQSNLGTAVRLPRFLRPYTQPLAVAGGMLSTGVAGLLFGWLRARTGNLAGSIVAHWLVDGVMIAALWWRRPRAK